MTVQLDKIQNASLRHSARGVELTRIAHLRDISARPDAVHRAALLAAGMPRYGDAHPSFPGLQVVDIALDALDVKQWRAVITYREPTAEELAHAAPAGSVIDVEYFSTQVTVDKLLDADGKRMFHWYSGNPVTYTIVGGNVVESRTAGVRSLGTKAERADVQIPSVGARVTMTETTKPRIRQHYIGTTNRGYWSGDAPETWLFVGLAGRKDRGRWINTYEVIYREDGWRLESIIEFNGAPPSDATEGNGRVRFKIYANQNFQQLGFEV